MNKTVKCIDDSKDLCGNNNLTLNKTYQVIKENEKTYLVLNDINVETAYKKTRFVEQKGVDC